MEEGRGKEGLNTERKKWANLGWLRVDSDDSIVMKN